LLMNVNAPNEQKHAGTPSDLQQRKLPRAEVERLCQLLLNGDAHVVDNGQHSALGALLVRLISDIFAFAPDKMLARPSQEEMQNTPTDGVQPTVIGRPFDPAESVLGSNIHSGQIDGLHPCVSTGASISVEAQPTISNCKLEQHSLPRQVDTPGPADLSPQHSADIVVLDEIQPIIQMLEHGSPEIKQQAKTAIESLNVQTQMALIHAGALKPLLELLGSSTAPVLVQFCASAASMPNGRHVAAAGRGLSQIMIAQNDIEGFSDVSLSAVSGLTELLRTGSPEGQAEAASALWSLSLASEAFKSSIIKAGAIKPMVSLLGASSMQGREEAAGVLWAILTGKSDPSCPSVNVEIMHADAINIVGVLNECGELGQEAAAGVISLIAANDLNKGYLVFAQCIEPLVGLLYSASDGVRSQAASALRSLCIYHPDVYKSGSRPELVQGAGEVKKLINFQLAPTMASPQHAALLEQLIYDMHDMVARVSGQEESASSLDSSLDSLSPAHRNNTARRVCVLRDMLEHASVEQKAEVRSSFLSLSVWLPVLNRSTQYCFVFFRC
jgi:hypothetical protein